MLQLFPTTNSRQTDTVSQTDKQTRQQERQTIRCTTTSHVDFAQSWFATGIEHKHYKSKADPEIMVRHRTISDQNSHLSDQVQN